MLHKSVVALTNSSQHKFRNFRGCLLIVQQWKSFTASTQRVTFATLVGCVRSKNKECNTSGIVYGTLHIISDTDYTFSRKIRDVEVYCSRSLLLHHPNEFTRKDSATIFAIRFLFTKCIHYNFLDLTVEMDYAVKCYKWQGEI